MIPTNTSIEDKTIASIITPESQSISLEEMNILSEFVFEQLGRGREIPRADAIYLAKEVIAQLGYTTVNPCHVVRHMEEKEKIPRKGNTYQL
ncbi:MAG: hypothetical protein ACP5N2_02745 [Candidatus Nanoarchaeia archaeon]